MQIHPLPAAFHSQLFDAGVESFELNFDRRCSYLDTSDDTGDVIVYDLTNGQVEHKEWHLERYCDETITQNLSIIDS